MELGGSPPDRRSVAKHTGPWGYSLRRGVAEFAVIVAGVLVALGVDEWRESLRDHTSETLYVERLIDDLRADTAELSGALVRGEEKDVRLRRLIGLSADDLNDEAGIRRAMEDLVRSQGWGWEYPTARRVTFDELLSVGGLRLVTDLQVREAISQYYWWHEDTEDRVEARRTDFPRLSYSLVILRPAAHANGEAPGDGTGMDGSYEPLRRAIESGHLRRAATAELNFTRYQRPTTSSLIERAEELLRGLEAYLTGRR